MSLVDLRSDGLRPGAAASAPSVVALLLHGFGSNERDLAGLVPMLGLDLPWASLRAPLPAGPGSAWFQITTPGSPDPAPVEERGHMSAGEAGELAARAGAGRLVLTHISDELDRERAIAEAATAYSGPVEVAAEGSAWVV